MRACGVRDTCSAECTKHPQCALPHTGATHSAYLSVGYNTAPCCFLCACVAKLQLIRKSSVDQVIPMLPSTIKPVMRDAFVEITALGARDLQPFALQPIYLPFVSCARGEGSWEKGWRACSVGLVASTALFAKCACGLNVLRSYAAHTVHNR